MPRRACPNQLWIDLLAAEREKLLERDSESNNAQNYAKVIFSLEREDTYYARPQDAIKKVKYLGAKISETLTKLLKKHGEAVDEDSDAGLSANLPKPKPKAKAKAKAKAAPARNNSDDEIDSDLDVLDAKATRKAVGNNTGSPPPPGKPKKRSSAANERVFRNWSSESEPEKKKAPAKNRKRATGDENVAAEPSKKKAKGKKEYVPRQGSAPYAMLIGLYEAYRDADDPIDDFNENLRTKEQIAELAQPHTQTDMITTNHKTGQHWSGMSSMTKLLEVDYMLKRGRGPVKYKLTGVGLGVASRMVAVAGRQLGEVLPLLCEQPKEGGEASEDEESPAASTSKAPAKKKAPKKAPADSESPAEARLAGPSRAPKASTSAAVSSEGPRSELPFEYMYLDDYNLQTKERGLADSKGLVDGTAYRILFKVSQKGHSTARHVAEKQARDDPALMEGYLSRAHSEATAPGLRKASATAAKPSGSRQVAADIGNLMGDHDERRALALAAAERRLGMTVSVLQGPPKFVAPPKRPSPAAESSDEEERPPAKRPKASTSASGSASRSTHAADAHSPPILPPSSKVSFQPRPAARQATGSTSRAAPAVNTNNCVLMRAGEYRVLLIIDHREIAAKLGGRFGIAFDTRSLEMGDAIWIAQRKVPTGIPENDEIVLDAVLERKRLDDLVGSIKDKRYDDQKLRMRMSGFTRLFYLNEDFDDTKIERDWDQQKWTTRSQSQVIDGFTTLHADSMDDVIQHHRRLTAIMTDVYKNKTLYGIKSGDVTRRHYQQQIRTLRENFPDDEYLPTYETFQAMNCKHHALYTEWAAIAHVIPGMSTEKTAAFVGRWPTMNHFYDDIELVRVEQGSEEEEGETLANGKKRKRKNIGESFVQDEVGSGEVRGIKQALSKFIWHLYTDSEYIKTKP